MTYGYDDNTRVWEVGDIVIHSFDAKEPKMLMRVVRWLPKQPDEPALVETEYVFPDKKGLYQNTIEALLDPRQFGFMPEIADWPAERQEQAQLDFENARIAGRRGG